MPDMLLGRGGGGAGLGGREIRHRVCPVSLQPPASLSTTVIFQALIALT